MLKDEVYEIGRVVNRLINISNMYKIHEPINDLITTLAATCKSGEIE